MTNSLSNGPERQLTDHRYELFFKFSVVKELQALPSPPVHTVCRESGISFSVGNSYSVTGVRQSLRKEKKNERKSQFAAAAGIDSARSDGN
jgi:hypothetical protein